VITELGQHGEAPGLFGLVGQQRLADGALLGVVEVAAQRVQALALVQLPGDLPAVRGVRQVLRGVDRSPQRAPFLQRGRQGVLAGGRRPLADDQGGGGLPVLQ
jgi:hypothetical protein